VFSLVEWAQKNKGYFEWETLNQMMLCFEQIVDVAYPHYT
jgi:hypothetical protein